jgi:hypothetical protein
VHLPEDVHRRLAARAVTDPDVASLLALFTNPVETVYKPPLDQAIEVCRNAQTLRGQNRVASARHNP